MAGMLALQPAALAAQDRQAPQRLEDLIPDSAIENPEGWAEDSADQEAPLTDLLAPGTVLPEEEFDGLELDMPGDLDIEEPDPLAPLPPEEVPEALAQAVELDLPPVPELELVELQDNLVIGVPADGSFEVRGEFIERFEALSTIEELDGDDDSVAQLAARARADEELLESLLEIYGYYSGEVIRVVRDGTDAPEGEDPDFPRVRFEIIPGERFSFGTIDLGNLTSAQDYDQLRASFGIETGDPLSSDKIVAERADLDRALGETGYPFAAIEDPSLLVDHEARTGDLTMPVEPNGKYVFGEVTSNLPDFLSGRHLSTIARFETGEVYQRSLELDLRRAVIATGLAASVSVTPREVIAPSGDAPGVVAMDVAMTKAELRTISGAVGYGSEEGIRLEAAWEHRNFFPPEGAISARGVIGTREQLIGVGFKRNNFRRRDQVLTLDAYASSIETEAVDARTVALQAGFSRLSNLLFQKPFIWSLGAEVLATDERNRVIGGIARPRRTYLIGALAGRATIDASDSLLNPTKGYRLSAFLGPEISQNSGSETFYLRNQLDATYYQSLNEKVVLAGRARIATIQGAQIFEIAPSRRLYAGGGGSVRGYAYQAIGPKNDFGEPTGGRSLVEGSVEARIQTGFFDGALSVVPFFDAASVSIDTLPDFRFVQYGAGLGVRYDTGFGPIRLDVGVPLNPDEFDAPVAVYVSLGQAF